MEVQQGYNFIEKEANTEQQGSWLPMVYVCLGFVLMAASIVFIPRFLPARHQRRARGLLGIGAAIAVLVLMESCMENPGKSIAYIRDLVKLHLFSFGWTVFIAIVISFVVAGKLESLCKWLLPLLFGICLLFVELHSLQVTDVMRLLFHLYAVPLVWSTYALVVVLVTGPTLIAFAMAASGLFPTAFPLPSVPVLKARAMRLRGLTSEWAHVLTLLGAADVCIFFVLPAMIPQTSQRLAPYVGMLVVAAIRFGQAPDLSASGQRMAFILVNEFVHVFAMTFMFGGKLPVTLSGIATIGAASRLGSLLAYNFITPDRPEDHHPAPIPAPPGEEQPANDEAGEAGDGVPADEPPGLGDPPAPQAEEGHHDHDNGPMIPGVQDAVSLFCHSYGGLYAPVIDIAIDLFGGNGDDELVEEQRRQIAQLQDAIRSLSHAAHITGILFARSLAAVIAVSIFRAAA